MASLPQPHVQNLRTAQCRLAAWITVWWQCSKKNANIFSWVDGLTQLALFLFNIPSNAKHLDFVIFIVDKMVDSLISTHIPMLQMGKLK